MAKKHKLGIKNWSLIWVLGMAGHICWNIENQWFNTFVYEEIAPNPSIISWMVAISAITTTISTFLFGTLSDRLGRRKPFITAGYILWGIFTIIFGFTMYVPGSTSGSLMLVTILIIMADAVMSFFGSMGNDSGFNPWTTDLLNDDNKGALGASLAVQPVLGTILGSVVGGMIIVAFGYVVFFTIMGTFVIAVGFISFLTLKESDTLVARKEGTFFQQFSSAFKFKEFFKIKELVWVNTLICVYFIGFNVYFVHLGNLFIYNYGFGEDVVGLIQGIGLIIAVFFTIPAIKLINNNKSPLLILITLVVNGLGLLILYFFGGNSDPSGLINGANVPLIIGIIFVGIGYVVFLQTTTVWAKKLYPSDGRGQFEGVRIIFFVLIPMIIGPLVANPIIKLYGETFTKEYPTGSITGQVPTELLFIVAAIIVLIGCIPLYKATKYHNQRIKEDLDKSKTME